MPGARFGAKSLAVLRVCERYQATHGYSPTVREILEETGLSSSSVVTYHLRHLERAGWLTWQERRARTIRVLRPSADWSVVHA